MKITYAFLLIISQLLISILGGTNNCTFPPVAKSESPEEFQNIPSDLAQKIERIENGLLLPVVIKGQPRVSMKLSERMQFHKTPGVSVAFINNGQIEWARAYGVSEVGGSKPVTTETLFQAGSISKSVTAVATMRLAEQGKLNLDDDVNQKLKSWKVPDNEFTKEQKVTVRRILSHTAGTTNNSVGTYASDAELPTLPQSLDGVKPANSPAVRVDFVPGSQQRYSGGGYTVLQQLLIDVTGKQFPEFMRETVLAPIGMKQSTFQQPLPKDLQILAASGYNLSGEKIAGNWRVFPESAAAGLWSTPSELARFLIEVQKSREGKSNKILSAETTKQMLTPQAFGWALGFVVEGENRTARFSHGGSTDGYRCVMVAYNAGQGAVIMTNADRGERLADEILRSLAREYGWSDFQPKEKTVAKVDPKVYADYVGRYEFEFSTDYIVTVGVSAGNLTTELKQPSGQTKTELLPESATRFFRTDVDLEVLFTKDDKGRVTHLTFFQPGQVFRAKKVK